MNQRTKTVLAVILLIILIIGAAEMEVAADRGQPAQEWPMEVGEFRYARCAGGRFEIQVYDQDSMKVNCVRFGTNLEE